MDPTSHPDPIPTLLSPPNFVEFAAVSFRYRGLSKAPVERLLDAPIQAQDLNDYALGHALDDLSTYGVSRLFGTVAFGIALDHKLLSGLAHLDSTSISDSGDSLHALAKLDSGGYPMAEGAALIGNLGMALILRGDGAARFTPIKDGANSGSYLFLPPLLDRCRYSDFIPERGMAAMEFVGQWQESNAPITIYENGVLKYTLRD